MQVTFTDSDLLFKYHVFKYHAPKETDLSYEGLRAYYAYQKPNQANLIPTLYSLICFKEKEIETNQKLTVEITMCSNKSVVRQSLIECVLSHYPAGTSFSSSIALVEQILQETLGLRVVSPDNPAHQQLKHFSTTPEALDGIDKKLSLSPVYRILHAYGWSRNSQYLLFNLPWLNEALNQTLLLQDLAAVGASVEVKNVHS